MSLRIFHRNVYLLVLVLTLLVCFGVGTSYGNVLAEKVYIKHRPVFARADVQAALPGILLKLGTPIVQKLLTPASIPLVANNPELLKPVVPGASPEFITAMKEDAALQKLLQDADFQKLMQNPIAINRLVALMTGVIEPEESWVFFRSFHYSNTLEEDVELVTNLKLGAPYLAGSQHTLIFTLTNKQTGQPVPSVRLASLRDPSKSTTKATFSPAFVITDKNGKAETQITIGDGDFWISVDIPLGPPVTFGGYDFSNLFVDGEVFDLQLDGLVSQREYEQLSRHKVTFTVRKQRTREPAPSIRLHLSMTGHGTSAVLFRPSEITTDKNGKAETYITFPSAPGSLVINISVHMEHEKRVTYRRQRFRAIYYEGERVRVDNDLRTNVAYRTGSKRKVIFTVTTEESNKPVPFAPLTLSAHSASTTTATFSPAVITTDKNGKAETQITFGEKPGRISIWTNIEQVFFSGIRYTGIVDGENVDLEADFSSPSGELISSTRFIPGSQDTLILTLTNRRTGKPVPSAGISLSLDEDKESTTTATFSPAIIITDKNGKAETQVTFGKKPGDISIFMEIGPSQRKAFFDDLAIPELPDRTGIVIDVMHDGKSEKLLGFSYRLGVTKTRKKLRVKTRSLKHGHTIPDVNLVFDRVGGDVYGIATFEPKEVRTDENGQAVIDITFPAGVKDVKIVVYVTKSVGVSIACTTPPLPIRTGGGGGDAFGLFGKGLQWDPDETVAKESGTIILTARFMNGKPDTHSFVEKIASQWSDHANVKFVFLPYVPYGEKTGPYDFPITFYPAKARRKASGRVNRSMVGSEIISISMRLTGLEEGLELVKAGEDDGWLKGLVLHEFGHILGLEHEHKSSALRTDNPDEQKRIFGKVLETPFAWDFDEMFKDPTLNPVVDGKRMTRAEFEKVVMSQYRELLDHSWSKGQKFGTNFITPFDPKSIMLYPINSAWNTAEYSTEQTTELSEQDKAFIGREDLYGPPKTVIKLAGKIEGRGKVYVHEGGFWGIGKKWVGHRFDWTKPVTFFCSYDVHSYLQAASASFHMTKGRYFRLYVGAPGRTGVSNRVSIAMVGDIATDRSGKPYAIDCERFAFRYGVTEEDRLIVLTNSFDGRGRGLGTFQVNVKDCYEEDMGLKLPYDYFFDPGNPEIDDYIQVDFKLTARPFKPSANEEDVLTGRTRAAPAITLTERPPMVPQVTTLLPNYPNPFNPETWIPYHLAKPSRVTLTIYAIDGKVVRHLDLGHQLEGFYQSKSHAAYWDGRNNVGERVATGLYFYTLTTGDFAATRKMLILK